MMTDDPIKQKRRTHWDMLKAQNPTLPDDEITSRVLQEIPGPAPVAAAGPQGLDYFKGLARQAGQGALMEFADEGEAALRTGSVSSPEYKTLRDRIRAQNDQFRTANPKASFGANVVGGLAVPGLGGAATVAKVAGRPLAKAALGAGLGALAGGTTGAGLAEEMDDVPGNALIGAGAGAVVGGVVTPVAGMLGRAAADSPWGRAAGNAIGAGVQGASKLLGPRAAQAGVAVNNAMNYDERMKDRAQGLLGSRIAATHTNAEAKKTIGDANTKFGVELTAADLSGNVSGLARSTANRVGKGRDDIPSFFAERQEMMPLDAPQKIPVLTNTPNASTPKNVRTEAMNKSISQRSAPNYREAHAEGEIIPSSDFVRTMESPMVYKAHGSVRTNELALRDAGQQYRPITPDLYDARGRLKKNPTVADLDGIKQHLDEQKMEIEALADKNGWEALGPDVKGRYNAIQALRDRVVQEGEDQLPKTVTLGGKDVNKWAFARAKHAEMSAPRDMYTEGTGFMRMSADQMRDFAQRAQNNPEMYEAAQEGVLKAVIELTETPSASGLNNPLRAALHPVRKQFLKTFLPKDKADALLGYGDLLKKQTKTAGDVLKNSTTPRQLIDDAEATSQSRLMDGAAKMASFATGGIAQKARTASDFVRALDAGINEKTAEYLSDYLTRSGPKALDLLTELDKAMNRRLNSRGAGSVVAGSMAGRLAGAP